MGIGEWGWRNVDGLAWGAGEAGGGSFGEVRSDLLRPISPQTPQISPALCAREDAILAAMFTAVFKDRTRSRLGRPRTPELVLGKLLQSRSLAPAIFQSRATLGPFVVDYVCFDRALVVELDDATRSSPGGSRMDARARFLNQLGYRVLRFRRAEVLDQPAQVIAEVRAALQGHDR